MVVRDFSCRPSVSRTKVQNHASPLEVNLHSTSANELRPMQTAAQRSTDVAGFEAAPGHFGKHRGKKKRVRVADQGDSDRGVCAELFLQTLCCSHAAKSSAQNEDPLLCRRDLQSGYGFWAKQTLGNVTQTLGDQAKRGAVEHPPDQSWEMRSHLFCGPLWHLAGNQRKCDHADQAPEWHAECTPPP